jgi:hypothetical protein
MAKNERLRSKLCQEISWWMKSAAIIATAGFTSVRTWAENALYTRTTMIQSQEWTFPTSKSVVKKIFFLFL